MARGLTNYRAMIDVRRMELKRGMRVLLLGAGASYGSDHSGTPPMGADLFEALRAFNPPGWGQLLLSLALAFRNDFERGMEELAKTTMEIT
ncbi:MAG: hypothetical protein A2X96_08245 [Syntrophobacterales bacterium GWC2_56_13]|nr:MAG: hypothetical protein A2X96_08245 [Syntrophobacterales bacterium GWC2_56_13]